VLGQSDNMKTGPGEASLKVLPPLVRQIPGYNARKVSGFQMLQAAFLLTRSQSVIAA